MVQVECGFDAGRNDSAVYQSCMFVCAQTNAGCANAAAVTSSLRSCLAKKTTCTNDSYVLDCQAKMTKCL